MKGSSSSSYQKAVCFFFPSSYSFFPQMYIYLDVSQTESVTKMVLGFNDSLLYEILSCR